MPHTLEELEEMLVNPDTANQKSTLINVVDDLLQIGPVTITLSRLKEKLYRGDPIDVREQNAFLLTEVRDLKDVAPRRGELPAPPLLQRRAGLGALGGKKRRSKKVKKHRRYTRRR